VELVCEYLLEAIWRQQREVRGNPGLAPSVNEDAAMILVDDHLDQAGATQQCSRNDVRRAFEYLTSPLVAAATWTDAGKTAIVVTRPN
jgi:hypothetical protein